MATMSKLKRKKLSVEESRSEQHSRIKKSNDSLCTVTLQDSGCIKTSNVTARERWWESSELSDAERLWALTLRALCPSLQSDQEESIPQLPPPSSTTTLVQKVSDWKWCSANEVADPPPDLPAPSFLTHSPPVNDFKNPSQPPAAKNIGESDSPALADQENYTSSPDQESVSVCDIQTAQQCHLEDKVNCVEGRELSDKHGDKFGQAGKVSEIQELTRGSGAGLDAGSREGGSGVGLDTESRAGGSGAGKGKKTGAGGYGLRLGTIPGTEGLVSVMGTKQRAGVSGSGQRAKSGAGGSGTGQLAISGVRGSGLGLVTKSGAGQGAKSGLEGSGSGLARNSGASGPGLGQGTKSGPEGSGTASGSGLDCCPMCLIPFSEGCQLNRQNSQNSGVLQNSNTNEEAGNVICCHCKVDPCSRTPETRRLRSALALEMLSWPFRCRAEDPVQMGFKFDAL
ncbi:hypothetical protein PO909_018563 [Leuciscus waleckii]